MGDVSERGDAQATPVAAAAHEDIETADPSSSTALLGADAEAQRRRRASLERQSSISMGLFRSGVERPLYQPAPEAAPGEEAVPRAETSRPEGDRWWLVVATLLAIQLGWGLWLMPYDYARLGWAGGTGAILLLGALTAYSAVMFGRLQQAVPNAVLFGDIGKKAYGRPGRVVCYSVVYSLDAARCVILHLAAAQSLQRAAGGTLGLWPAGGVVSAAVLSLSQVQKLARLGWLLSAGSLAQQAAIALVLVRLLLAPDTKARTCALQSRDRTAALVALMNVVFAFGGQFSWLEVMNTMRKPEKFPAVSGTCTAIMTAAYLAIGGVGYWSKGDAVTQIVLFSLERDVWAHAAACLLLLQALGQYLANINMWTLNICTLLGRRGYIAVTSQGGLGVGGGYPRLVWAAITAFITSYSFLVSALLPFFPELVAFTLPAAFCLKLVPGQQPPWESRLQVALIPISIAFSALGLYSSFAKLVQKVLQQAAADGSGSQANAA